MKWASPWSRILVKSTFYRFLSESTSLRSWVDMKSTFFCFQVKWTSLRPWVLLKSTFYCFLSEINTFKAADSLEIIILLFFEWNQHLWDHALMWNEHLTVWSEMNIFEVASSHESSILLPFFKVKSTSLRLRIDMKSIFYHF